MTLKHLIDEVEKLSPLERVELLDAMLDMPNVDVDVGLELTPNQAADLDRRIAEYEAGQAELIDVDVAMARLRARR